MTRTEFDELAAEALRLYEERKLNTNQIAKRLKMPEPDVEFALQYAREARQRSNESDSVT